MKTELSFSLWNQDMLSMAPAELDSVQPAYLVYVPLGRHAQRNLPLSGRKGDHGAQIPSPCFQRQPDDSQEKWLWIWHLTRSSWFGISKPAARSRHKGTCCFGEREKEDAVVGGQKKNAILKNRISLLELPWLWRSRRGLFILKHYLGLIWKINSRGAIPFLLTPLILWPKAFTVSYITGLGTIWCALVFKVRPWL